MVYETKVGISDTVLDYRLPSKTELDLGILLNPGCVDSPVLVYRIIIDEDGIHYCWDEYNELCRNDLMITPADLEEHRNSDWTKQLFEVNAGQELAFRDEETLVMFVRRAAEAYGIRNGYTLETCPYVLSSWTHSPCSFHGLS